MKVFFDSSSYIKKFINEKGSHDVDEYCQKASSLGLSVICLPEMMSALNRKIREGHLSEQNYKVIKSQLVDDIEDIDIINLSSEVIDNTIILLENNHLRSLDALHVACAIV